MLIILGLLIISYPYLGNIIYSINNFDRNESIKKNKKEYFVEKNSLFISKIGVASEILSGDNPSLLERGVWMRPKSAEPGENGNVILTAHRFLFTKGPKTFYHLDKMKIGDKISIKWSGASYEYEVSEIKTVHPDDIRIEENTETKQLTLYTCTPLWTSKKRLVVIAKPASSP